MSAYRPAYSSAMRLMLNGKKKRFNSRAFNLVLLFERLNTVNVLDEDWLCGLAKKWFTVIEKLGIDDSDFDIINFSARHRFQVG